MKKLFPVCLIPILIGLNGTIAISVHVLLIQYFVPPVFYITPELNDIIGLMVKFFTVAGAILIFELSKIYWTRLHLFIRVILFAILLMALTEQLLRSPLMDIAIGAPPAYTWLAAVMSYASFLTLSLLICLFMNKASINDQFIFLKYFLFSITVTAILLIIKSETIKLLSQLPAIMQSTGMTELRHLPYGAEILIPAYITFIEPALASLVLLFLIKDAISGFKTATKGLIIGAILITVHGGIYSVVQIFMSEGNLLYRIFYYGQFLWEYLVLGLLTAFSATLICNPKGTVRSFTYRHIS